MEFFGVLKLGREAGNQTMKEQGLIPHHTGKKLQRLEDARDFAAVRLHKALQERWPRGTEIEVILSSGQVNPTRGEVLEHYGDEGVIAVQLFKVNRRGNRTVKRVHWTRCHD